MKPENFFLSGFRATIPILTGVIPFGAVMGTVCFEAKLSLAQSMGMNFIVYAGASQLAAVDLMNKNAASLVVILTGLIINLRFLLYSAALSPVVHRSHFLIKLFSAYSLTDQAYAVMSANEKKLGNASETTQFYLGSTVCMMITWHSSVIAGYIFGNFAPAALSLDFAVPLSFAALVIPTIKNRIYLAVAVFSSIMSLLLYRLPFKTGLIATALLSIGLAAFLTRKKVRYDRA
jgi:predicted branched-subunit amino acid permease